MTRHVGPAVHLKISLALLGLLFLAACVTNTNPPEAQPSVTTAPQATSTAAPPTVALPTAAPQATLAVQPTPKLGALVLWTSERAENLEALKGAADEWSQRSGTPISVVSKSHDGMRVDAIADQLLGSSAPAMFWGDQGDLAGLLADGHIQPFGTVDGAGAFIAATVSSGARDGQLWGMPIAAQGELLLLYNRTISQQPPTTTDELIVQSRAAGGPDHYGLVAGWAEARWLVALLTGYGGAALSPDGTSPTLNTPEMLNALNLLRELRVAGPPAPSTYERGSKLFGDGQVAFALDGDWSLSSFRALSATLDLGVAPMPRVPSTGRIAAPPLGGTYLMFGKSLSGEALTQAQNFAAFLATPDQQVRLAVALERLPALKVALAAPAIANDPVLAAAAQQIEGASGMPPTQALRCAWNAISAQLPPLLNNERNQTEAAAAMQSAAEECMAR